ncbi:hypothetical protein A2U01_0076306, partial [Trifolium medium]|nr:hypothetical protein [Trifolium medium]
MKLSTRMYLEGQDGLVHHTMSCRHPSSRNGDPFHPMKVKQTSLSLAIQQFMA